MSENFWKILSTVVGYIVLATIFGLLIFVANIEIKDLDLWLHIGVGRHIVQHGFFVPSVDILSCTMAGKPWINHEWLFQIVVYNIYRFWGADGLILMQVILVSLTTLILLLLGYNKNKQLAVIFSLLLVSLVYQTRFTIRPDLYSLLFFTLYIFILSFHINKRWAVYPLFVIQILWTNMHGFFFFGPLFVLIGLVAEWLKRHARLPYEWNTIGRLTDEEYKRLGFVFVFVTLACLFNPLTFRGAWYPISVFFQISGDSRIFFDKIVELQKPITWATIWDTGENPYYKLLILISFVSFVFNRWRIDVGTLIFWLIFLFFSLAAVRNMVFFAFAAYLVFIINAYNIALEDMIPFRITDRKFVHISSVIAKIFFVFWTLEIGMNISANGYFDFDTYERKSEFGGISQRIFPNKAADFLVQNHVRGNFFNDFNSGAYLVGRCSPDIRVFIDGRTEVYGPEFFKEYMNICEKDNVDLFKKSLEQYKITGVLLNTVQQPAPPRIANYLYDSNEWVAVYLNYDGIIFLKDVPENRDVIAKRRIDFRRWQAEPMDIYRLGSKKVLPYRHINRAYSLEALGFDNAALAELDEALKVTPVYHEPYKLRGKIHAKHKEYQQAFENFRIAVLFQPTDRQDRKNLALAYYDLGKYEYAIEQYQRIIEYWPSKVDAYFLLARAYLKAQKYEKALAQTYKAHALDPSASKDLFELGDMFYEAGKMKEAEEVYQLVAQTKEREGERQYKLGKVYSALGQAQRARGAFDRALPLVLDNRVMKEEVERLRAAIP